MADPKKGWPSEEFIAEDKTREHGSSAYQLIMGHKRICFWTFFFAMSGAG
jgi:hypothetical protein